MPDSEPKPRKPWIDPTRVSAANSLSAETIDERRRQAAMLVVRADGTYRKSKGGRFGPRHGK
jgi:hypothetical protein